MISTGSQRFSVIKVPVAKWTPAAFKMLMLNKHCGGARGGRFQRDLTKAGEMRDACAGKLSNALP